MDSPTLSTAYVYARGHWNQPFLRLPALNKVNTPESVSLQFAASAICHCAVHHQPLAWQCLIQSEISQAMQSDHI